jgi:hypothetical protein
MKQNFAWVMFEVGTTYNAAGIKMTNTFENKAYSSDQILFWFNTVYMSKFNKLHILYTPRNENEDMSNVNHMK